MVMVVGWWDNLVGGGLVGQARAGRFDLLT